MSRKSAPPNPETRAADEYFREPETLAPETTEPPAEIEAEEEAPESPAETPEESIEPEEPAAGPIRKIEESRTLRTPLSQDHISAEEKPEEGSEPEDQGEADEPEEPGEEEVTGALEGQGETQEEAIHV